ncbi:MAG: hypothetical protein KAX13_07530, partial [Candidatus Krumholzibacteria bacterium]|nr:hypothetical protein [Candidatus Krumholzibacteria bacterium]
GGVYILPQSPLGMDTIDASVAARANGTEFRDFSADDAVGVWFIQSAASFAYEAGSLDPAAVSQLQSHAFSLSMRNDGEAVVTLDGAQTTLSFTDGTNTFNVPLGSNLALSGSSTTGMTFTEAVIPAAMIPGSYQIEMHLEGSENGGVFDTTFTLSDQVTITSPAQVEYIPGTLDPTTVSKRSTVAFELGIDNKGSATVQCIADSTWISFSDGSASYRAILDRNQGTSIGPGADTLYFVSETIPEDIATGYYPSGVRIYGTENGLPFEEAIFPSDGIDVEDPSDLAINSITVTPLPTVTADQGREWYAVMNVQNYGEASVQLDSLEMRLFNGATNVTDEVQITQIDFVPETVLTGGQDIDLQMEFIDNAANPMTTGTVIIDANVWGLDLNSSEILTATTETGGKGSYLVQTQADLVILDVIPSVDRATVLQTKDWMIDAVIRNDGQSDIDISFDTDSTFVTFSTSGDFLVIRPAELAGGGTILAGGSTDTLRFVVDQTGSMNGDCFVNAIIGGTETNSLRLLPLVSDGTPAHVAIQSEATLVINRLTPLQDPVTLSQTPEWSIEMEVTNSGESYVTVQPGRTDSTWVAIPAGTGFVIGNPAGFLSGGTSLGGGETKLLHFAVSATGSDPPGSQEIRGAVYAIEENSGRPVYAERSGSDYVTLQRRPDPAYVLETLSPTVVSRGTGVSINLDLESDDPDHSTLLFDLDKTTVSFSDGEGDTYTASLSPQSVDDALIGGGTADLTFESATVDPNIERQSYSVAIHVEGTENGNFFEADLETATDSLRVEDASQLSINDIVLSQSSVTVGQTSEWQAMMIVENNGEAAVDLDLDPAKTRLAFIIGESTVTSEYAPYIIYPTELLEAGNETLSGNATGTLVFTITRTGTTVGLMSVHGYIEGIDINSEELLTDNTFEGGWGNMVVQAPGDPVVDSMTPEQPTVTSNQTTNWDITVAVCNNGGSELTYLIDSTRVEIVPEYPLPYIKPTQFDEGGTSLSAGECKHLTFTVTSTPDIPGGEDLILHSR